MKELEAEENCGIQVKAKEVKEGMKGQKKMMKQERTPSGN